MKVIYKITYSNGKIYIVWESVVLANYDEQREHDYPTTLSLTHQFQALAQLQPAHLQCAWQLVAQIQARKMV